MARPLGVAVVVYNIDARGGMERQAAQLARQLAARGARVTLLSTFVPPGAGLPLPARPPRRERAGGLEVLRFPLLWWTFEGAPRLFEAWLATALLRRRRRIDAIYAVHHKAGSHAATVAPLLARPVAVKFACAGEPGDFASIRREPDRVRYEVAIRRADRYLCLSPEIEREARAAGLDPVRFLAVQNGVDLARFAPRPAGTASGAGEPRVLFVGRLDRQKRLDTLLRAMKLLSERGVRARLLCAGTGPHEAELRALARTLGLEGAVDFLGARDDVPELLGSASVFVLPSEAEGLSNALLEALASETPVVASDIPANARVVTSGREGLLVPPGDERALADAIARLLQDRELAGRLARAGRERVLAAFDLASVVAHHEELFRRLGREKRAGGTEAGRILGVAKLWAVAIAVTLRSAAPHALARLARLVSPLVAGVVGRKPARSQSQANR